MVSKVMKQRQQINPFTKREEIIGVGEFAIPTSYKWACSNNMVHITTRDKYRGIVSTEIPIDVIRDILSQVDRAAPIIDNDANAAIQDIAANLFVPDEAEELKAARLKQIENQMDEMIQKEEDPEVIQLLDKKIRTLYERPLESPRKKVTKKPVKKSTAHKKEIPKTTEPKEIKKKPSIFDLLPPEKRPKNINGDPRE